MLAEEEQPPAGQRIEEWLSSGTHLKLPSDGTDRLRALSVSEDPDVSDETPPSTRRRGEAINGARGSQEPSRAPGAR